MLLTVLHSEPFIGKHSLYTTTEYQNDSHKEVVQSLLLIPRRKWTMEKSENKETFGKTAYQLTLQLQRHKSIKSEYFWKVSPQWNPWLWRAFCWNRVTNLIISQWLWVSFHVGQLSGDEYTQRKDSNAFHNLPEINEKKLNLYSSTWASLIFSFKEIITHTMQRQHSISYC